MRVCVSLADVFRGGSVCVTASIAPGEPRSARATATLATPLLTVEATFLTKVQPQAPLVPE